MPRTADPFSVGPRGLVLSLSLVIPCGCSGVDRDIGEQWDPPNDGEQGNDGEPTDGGEPTDESSSDTGEDDTDPGDTDDDDGAGTSDEGATDEGEDSGDEDTTAGETTGGSSDICEGMDGEPLVPPVTCDGPGGNTTTEKAPNGLYATSWFGCYMQDNGTIYHDPYDNCEFACGNQGLCPPDQSGPECEANLRWFAADADRFGCGGRIRVTNCENGKAVILVTLDRGPNCNTVEKACDAPVLDMSHDAMVHLFDGGIYGGCDHQTVVVEEVDPATQLGPA